MFARVTSSQVTPDRVEAMVGYVQSTLVPAVKQIPGVKASYFLADRQSGKGMTVTIYESADAMRAADERARQLRAGATQDVGGDIENVQHYEVVGQV
jgi:hypothetical protein